MTDLPESAVKALYLFVHGAGLVIYADDRMGVALPCGAVGEVTGDDLAELDRRALIRVEDGPDGEPRAVIPTGYGRDFLKRWLAIRRVTIVPVRRD